VLYFAPPDSADRLATIHEIHKQQIRRLPSKQRRRWERAKSSSWPRLTSPTTLVDQIEAELGTPIEGKEMVLHDLWPARALPSLPLFQRLELVLAGFDLTFVLDDKYEVEVLPMPLSPRITQKVEIPASRLDAVTEVLNMHSSATLKNSELTASWRVHELVKRTIAPPSTDRNLDRIRYTLRAENQPLGPFVRSLCRQLDLECEFTDAATIDLEKRISFQVDRADVRTLFRKILEPTGLRFTLDNKKLRVVGPRKTR
jgi:hypothetical protein